MHKWLMEQGKCLKTEVEKKGIDNLTKDDLEEAAYFSKMLKNLMCLEKDGKIVEAMEESENEDNMKAIEMYEDYPEKKYYDNYRYSNGRFAPKGKGSYMGRRGYEEYPYMRMPENMRDMDREDMGKMYYSEPMSRSMNGSMSESNYDRAKRNYTETKEMHKSNTAEDKEMKMKSLDMYMKELSADITSMIEGMTPEEKNLLRNKMSTLVSKI